MGEKHRNSDINVRLNITIFIISMLLLIWMGIFFTQLFLPIGFEIIVIAMLVFTSKISVFVKQALY